MEIQYIIDLLFGACGVLLIVLFKTFYTRLLNLEMEVRKIKPQSEIENKFEKLDIEIYNNREKINLLTQKFDNLKDVLERIEKKIEAVDKDVKHMTRNVDQLKLAREQGF